MPFRKLWGFVVFFLTEVHGLQDLSSQPGIESLEFQSLGNQRNPVEEVLG